MKTIVTFLIFLISTNLFGYDRELVKLFLKNSSSVVQFKATAMERDLDAVSVIASKSWGISLGSSYNQNKLDGTVMQGANNRHVLGLAKEFFWGGHLSFSTGYGKVDTYANSFMPVSQSNYEFTQTLSYTQDLGSNFFGINDRIDIDLAEKGAKLGDAEKDFSIDQALLTFYSRLIELRLNKSLTSLEAEALVRAIKREKMIERRVKDGLLEKVDHYQASMAVLMRQEAVKSSSMNLTSSIKNIISDLHQDIDLKRIDKLEKRIDRKLPQGSWDTSPEREQLSRRIELLKSSMKKINYSFIPELKLSTMYKTNSYEATKKEAIDKGNLGGEKGELSVGLSLSMPLWFKPQKVEKQKLSIQLKTAQTIYEKRERSFVSEIGLTKNQIDLLDKNIISSKRRVALAKKVLREYNKLYNLGRADLDQVIRAEEDLINTEKSFIGYLSQHEGMRSTLSFLTGTLQRYLLEE